MKRVVSIPYKMCDDLGVSTDLKLLYFTNESTTVSRRFDADLSFSKAYKESTMVWHFAIVFNNNCWRSVNVASCWGYVLNSSWIVKAISQSAKKSRYYHIRFHSWSQICDTSYVNIIYYIRLNMLIFFTKAIYLAMQAGIIWWLLYECQYSLIKDVSWS